MRRRHHRKRFVAIVGELLESRHLLTSQSLVVGDWLEIEGEVTVDENRLLLEDATLRFLGLPAAFDEPRLDVASLDAFDDDQNGQIDGVALSGVFPMPSVSLGFGATELLRINSPAFAFESFVYRPLAGNGDTPTGSVALRAESAVAFPTEFVPLLGDLDADGDVDEADRATLLDNWTGALAAGAGQQRANDGDLDGDEDVDTVDYTLLVSNWTTAADVQRMDVGMIDVASGTLNISLQTPSSAREFPLAGLVPMELSTLSLRHAPHASVSTVSATGVPKINSLARQWRDDLQSPALSLDLAVFDESSETYEPHTDQPITFDLVSTDGLLLPANTPAIRLSVDDLVMPLSAAAGSVTYSGSLAASGFDARGFPRPLGLPGSSADRHVRLELTPTASSALGNVSGLLQADGSWTLDEEALRLHLQGLTQLDVSDRGALGEPGAGELLVALQWPLASIGGSMPTAEPNRINASAVAGELSTLQSIGAGLEALRQLLGNLPARFGNVEIPLPVLANDLDAVTVLQSAVDPWLTGYLAEFEPSGVDYFKELMDRGYTVTVCDSGRVDCNEDDLFRISLDVPGPATLPVTHALDASRLAGLEELNVEGDVLVHATPAPVLRIGLDADGLYLDAASRISLQLDGTVDGSGNLGPFPIDAMGSFELIPTLVFSSLDANGDGKLRASEIAAGNLNPMDIQLDQSGGALRVELPIEQLDYIDVDFSPYNNSENGGDAFRFVAKHELLPHAPTQPFDFAWSSSKLLNPDVDENGFSDFTSRVFVDNVRLAALDLIRAGNDEFMGAFAALFADQELPLTQGSLAEAFDVANSVADWALENTTVVHVIPFETVGRWLAGELGDERPEIVRLNLALDDLSLNVSDDLQFDLTSFLPATEDTTALVRVEEAKLDGNIVFGIDMSPNPFYVLGSPDDLQPGQVTRLGGSVTVAIDMDGQPLGPNILRLQDARAELRLGLDAAFRDLPDGKFRIGDPLPGPQNLALSLRGGSGLFVAAKSAELFPNNEDALLHGSADYLRGSLDLNTAAFQLSAARVGIDVQDAVSFAASNVALGFDPTSTDDDVELARLENVNVVFPSLPTVPSGSIDAASLMYEQSTATFTVDFAGIEIRTEEDIVVGPTPVAAAHDAQFQPIFAKRDFAFDIIDQTDPGESRGFAAGVSINADGTVAYAELSPLPTIHVAPTSGAAVSIIDPSGEVQRFGDGVTINDQGKIVTVVRANGNRTGVRQYDLDNPTDVVEVADETWLEDDDRYTGIPWISNDDKVVYTALRNGAHVVGLNEDFSITPPRDGTDPTVQVDGPIRPIIADERGPLDATGVSLPLLIGTRTSFALYEESTISDELEKFKPLNEEAGQSWGLRPGMSDDGRVVAFYSNSIFAPMESPAARAEGIGVIIDVSVTDDFESPDPDTEFFNPELEHLVVEADGQLIRSLDVDAPIGVATKEIDDDRLAITLTFIAETTLLSDGSRGAPGRALFSKVVIFDRGHPSVLQFNTATPDLIARVGDKLAGLEGTISDLRVHDAVNGEGQVAFWVEMEVRAGGDVETYEAVVRANPVRHPIVLIPDAAASQGQCGDDGKQRDFVLTKGLPPEQLELSCLSSARYMNLIETLRGLGYVLGEDLIVANYDWQLPPVPDGETDLDRLTDATFESQIEYVAHAMKDLRSRLGEHIKTIVIADGNGKKVFEEYAKTALIATGALAGGALAGAGVIYLGSVLAPIGAVVVLGAEVGAAGSSLYEAYKVYQDAKAVWNALSQAWDLISTEDESVQGPGEQTLDEDDLVDDEGRFDQTKYDEGQLSRQPDVPIVDESGQILFRPDDAIPPTTTIDTLSPGFRWGDLLDGEFQHFNLYVSVKDRHNGLLPRKVAGTANHDELPCVQPDDPDLPRDMNPGRVLTVCGIDGSADEFPAGELALTASQTYYVAVEGVRSDGETELAYARFKTPSVTTSKSNSFSSVTVLTHGFQLPYFDEAPTTTDDLIQMAHDIAKTNDGLVLRYDPKTGAWHEQPNEFKRPETSFGLPVSQIRKKLGRSLVLLTDWGLDSGIGDVGFSEAAADAIFAGIVQLNQDLDNAIFNSPLHMVGFSRGTIVTSELVQRLGVHYPELGQGGHDLHMTLLDPHDYYQPNLEIDFLDPKWLPITTIVPGLGLPLLTGVSKIPYADFFEPEIHVWDNVTFADNYWQSVGNRDIAFRDDGEIERIQRNSFVGFTPNGRPLAELDESALCTDQNQADSAEDASQFAGRWTECKVLDVATGASPAVSLADIDLQLNGAAGFIQDDRLLGEGAPHQRVKTWYAGTIDLAPSSFASINNDPIHRGELPPPEDYTDNAPQVGRWYANAAQERVSFDPGLPAEGTEAGWAYSVQGGTFLEGGAERPSRPDSAPDRVPVDSDNTVFGKGDLPVPSVFNGNFEATIRPTYGRFPIPLNLPGAVLGNPAELLSKVVNILEELVQNDNAFDEQNGVLLPERRGELEQLVTVLLAIRNALPEGFGEELDQQVCNLLDTWRDLLDWLPPGLAPLGCSFLNPSWREIAGWSFHGGTGGWEQGNQLVSFLAGEKVEDLLEDLGFLEQLFKDALPDLRMPIEGAFESIADRIIDTASKRFPVVELVNSVLNEVGLGLASILEGLTLAVTGAIQNGYIDHSFALSRSASKLTHNRLLVPGWADRLSLDLQGETLDEGDRLHVYMYEPNDQSRVPIETIEASQLRPALTTFSIDVPDFLVGRPAQISLELEFDDDPLHSRILVDNVWFKVLDNGDLEAVVGDDVPGWKKIVNGQQLDVTTRDLLIQPASPITAPDVSTYGADVDEPIGDDDETPDHLPPRAAAAGANAAVGGIKLARKDLNWLRMDADALEFRYEDFGQALTIPDYGVLTVDVAANNPDKLIGQLYVIAEYEQNGASQSSDLPIAHCPTSNEACFSISIGPPANASDPKLYELDYGLSRVLAGNIQKQVGETFHFDVSQLGLHAGHADFIFKFRPEQGVDLGDDDFILIDNVGFQSAPLLFGNPDEARPTFAGDDPSEAEQQHFLIEHPQYTLSYNDDWRFSNWSSWIVDASWLGQQADDTWLSQEERSGGFRRDPALLRSPASDHLTAVTGDSYPDLHRGHLSPDADRSRAKKDQRATYFMTNMVPQDPKNNTGQWRVLEDYTRSLIKDLGFAEAYVIAGGYVTSNPPAQVANRDPEQEIEIPDQLWKVIVAVRDGYRLEDLTQGGQSPADIQRYTHVVAVDMPNDASVADWKQAPYIVTIDTLEQRLNATDAFDNFDLLSALPQEIEDVLESALFRPIAQAAGTTVANAGPKGPGVVARADHDAPPETITLGAYPYYANPLSEREDELDLFGQIGNATVIVSTGQPTVAAYAVRQGPGDGARIYSVEDGFRVPDEDEFWLEPRIRANYGDGESPLTDLVEPHFDKDNVNLISVAKGSGSAQNTVYTDGSVQGSDLVANPDVIENILGAIGLVAPDAAIVSSHKPIDISRALSLSHIGAEAFVVDAQGRRTGYSQQTGVLTEIPNSYFWGQEYGTGYIVDVEPGEYRYEVVSGDNYLVRADVNASDMDGHLRLTGSVEGNQLVSQVFEVTREYVGPGVPKLLEITEPRIAGHLQLSVGGSGFALSGDLELSADSIAVFPDTATAEVDGMITGEDVKLRVDFDSQSPTFGKVVISAGAATVDLDDTLQLSATGDAADPAIEIILDPAANEIATIRNLSLDVPAIENWPVELTSIDELQVRRDGFGFVKSFGVNDPLPNITLGDAPRIVDISRPQITVAMDVTIPSGFSRLPQITGSVAIGAASATLFPDSDFSASITDDESADERPGILGTLDLATGEFDLELRRMQAALTDLFLLTASPADDQPAARIHFDPLAAPDDVLLSLPAISGSVPLLAVNGQSPAATVAGFGIRYDGGVELDSLVIDLPDGYTKEIPGGGFVPIEVSQLSAEFGELSDGTVDFSSVRLAAIATVDTSSLEERLGGLLPQRPSITIQRYDAAGVLTDLSDGGELVFSLLVENGELMPAAIPGFRLGLDNLALDLPAGQTVTLAGSFTLPSISPTGVPEQIPASLVPVALAGSDLLVLLDLEATADVTGGVLGGEVLVGGTLTTPSSDVALLELDGQAVIAGDVSLLGGGASGSVTADFSWNLLTQSQPDGTLTLSGAPQIGGLLFEQIELEIAGLARLTVDQATVDFDAPSGEAVATATDARLEFLIEGLAGVGGTIGLVRLFDDQGNDGVVDGFSIEDVTLGGLGTLSLGPALGDGDDSLLELTGASLTIPDLTYRNGALTADLPDFSFSAVEIALTLPGVNAEATGLSLLLDPNNQEFLARADAFSLGVGDTFAGGSSLFNLQLTDPTLIVDQDDATDLLSVASAELTFGPDAAPLDALKFDVTSTPANQDQAFRFNLIPENQTVSPRFGFGDFALSTTTDDNVLASLGLGGLLPLDVSSATLAFPETLADGYTDLSVFDLTVLGAFDFSVFGELPFTPHVSIGQTPHRDEQVRGGTASTDDDQFNVQVAFDFSGDAPFPVIPVFQDVVLGLSGLELGGFTFGGEVALAGYRLDENGRPIALAYGVNTNSEQVLVDALSDADPNEAGDQLGTQIAGRLGVVADDDAGSGSVGVVDFDFNSLEVLLAGAIVPAATSTTVQLVGDLDVDGTVRFGDLIVLDSFGLSGALDWTMQNDLSSGELSLSIDQARTRGITIGLGDFFAAAASGSDEGPDGTAGTSDDGLLAINFSDDPTVPLLQGLDLTLGSPAIGLYGGIEGIDVFAGAVPDFDGIDEVVIGVEPGSMLDTLQDWFLPIRTNEIAVDFEDGFFDVPIGTDEQGNPLDVHLRIDGAVGLPGFIGDALGDLGLDAEVAFAGLGVDVGKLRDLSAELLQASGALAGASFDAFISANDQDAIAAAFAAGLEHIQTNGAPFTIFELGGVIDLSQLNALGIELGFELGDGIAVRGALSVGKVDANQQVSDSVDDVYFLAIDGAVKVSSYGGGGTLVMTTAGPIAATIEFGVPIPIGQTTLTVGGSGGIVFGKDLLDGVDTSQPTVNPADIPTPLEWDLTDIPTIEGILGELWDETTNTLTPVWNLPATLAIEGRLSSLAVLGLISVDGTLAASLPSLSEAVAGEGLSFLGVGDFNIVGMPFASGGVLVDARDLLNPAVSFGFRAPPKDNPLAFLFPVQADLAGTFRSDGMIEAWLLGFKTLLEGAIDNAQGPVAQLLDVVAAEIERDRQAGVSNSLAALLSLSENDVLTGESLGSQLLSLFGSLSGESPAGSIDPSSSDPWTVAARAANELWTQFQLAADQLPGFDFTAAIGQVFSSLLVGAANSADEAVVRAYNAFNPSFVLRGAIQPSILGFAIGDPTNEVDLVINKQRITLDLTASNILATALAPLRDFLGLSDRLEVGFSAQLPGTLIDVLINPETTPEEIAAAFGDALNPFTGWEAKLAGSISLLGVELGKVNGVIFGPQQTDNDGRAVGGTLFAENVYNFGYADDFELTGENTDLPAGFESSIPVYFDRHYNNMTAFGGMLLTGELKAPNLLRDPIPTFTTLVDLTRQTGAALAQPWADLTDENLDLADLSNAGDVASGLQTYFEQVVAVLTDQTPVGTLQFYVPSPATLVDNFLDYAIPSVVGGGDGGGEVILADRVPGEDAEGNLAFAPATPFDAGFTAPPLRFADLNNNAFYDPRIDVLLDDEGNIWSDEVPDGSSIGDLLFGGAGEVVVPEAAIQNVPQLVLNDVADDEGNGFLDPTPSSRFQAGVSVGFIDLNHNGVLDWSADTSTGSLTFHEPIVNYADGGDVGDSPALPNLVVFLDAAALAPNGVADGYTAPTESAAGDRLIGLNEGFLDTNENQRFDLGTDILYDLNGNGLPDGELFIDVDADGRYTLPEPLDDINGNGVRDVSDSLTEPFTDLNGNDAYDLGDPILELGNGLYDPPAEPVFTFDSVSQQAQDLFSAAYMDGFADVRLFGLDLGSGRVRADASGLFLDISTGPYGADFSVGLGFNELNAGEMLVALADGPLAAAGGDSLLQVLLPPSLSEQTDSFQLGIIDLAGNFSFAFPVAALDAGFDLGAIQSWLAESFGRPVGALFEFTEDNGLPLPTDATAQVDYFSPLFAEHPPSHPTADPGDPRFVVPPLRALDDIQRYGGGRVSATLNIPNFVEGAVGVFESQFPNSPDDLLAPDFAFLAKADRLAIPGLSDDILRAENLSISMVKDTSVGSAVARASIRGAVGVLEGFGGGVSGAIHGQLTLDAREGVLGHLSIQLDAESISLDPNGRLQIGADADVRLLVNGTNKRRAIEFTQSTGATTRTRSADVDAQSGILWIDGELLLGSARIAGTFLVQASPSGIIVSGAGQFSDATASLLLGPQLDAGVDVTFAAGIERAVRNVVVVEDGNPVRRQVPDGAFGVFLFSTDARLALAQSRSAFSVGFNASSRSQTLNTDLGQIATDLRLPSPTIPDNLSQLLRIGAGTGRLFVSGDLTLDQLATPIGAEGNFAAAFSLTGALELDLYADTTVDLGMFGSVSSRGYVELGGTPTNVSAAGYFELQSDRFGVRDVAEFSGAAALSFNSGRTVDIPAFIRTRSLLGNIAIDSGTFVKLELDEARVDLFDTFAVGGSGELGLSARTGLSIGAGLGVEVRLPNEITAAFGGLLPTDAINLIGRVPPGSTSDAGLLPRPNDTFRLPIDLTRDGDADITVERSPSGELDVHGGVRLGAQDRAAFGGLFGADGDFQLSVNTTARPQAGAPAPGSFLLMVDGEIFFDPIPGAGNTADGNVSVAGDFEVLATSNRIDIDGRGQLAATVLGAELVGAGVIVDARVDVAGGTAVLADARFTGNLTLLGQSVFNATARLTPDGCLDLPDPLPDGCPLDLPTGLGTGPPETVVVRVPNPAHAAWVTAMAACQAAGFTQSQCINGVASTTGTPALGPEAPETITQTVPNPERAVWNTAMAACQAAGFTTSQCINGVAPSTGTPALGPEPPTTITQTVTNPARTAWNTAMAACQAAGFSTSQCINGVAPSAGTPALGPEPSETISGQVPNPAHATWETALAACRATGLTRSQCINGVFGVPGIGSEPSETISGQVPNPAHAVWETALAACRAAGFSTSQCINGVAATTGTPALGPAPPATITQTIPNPAHAAWTQALALCRNAGFTQFQCINGVSPTTGTPALGPAPPASITQTVSNPEHAVWETALAVCRAAGFSTSQCINGVAPNPRTPALGPEPPQTLTQSVPNPARKAYDLALAACELLWSTEVCINGFTSAPAAPRRAAAAIGDEVATTNVLPRHPYARRDPESIQPDERIPWRSLLKQRDSSRGDDTGSSRPRETIIQEVDPVFMQRAADDLFEGQSSRLARAKRVFVGRDASRIDEALALLTEKDLRDPWVDGLIE